MEEMAAVSFSPSGSIMRIIIRTWPKAEASQKIPLVFFRTSAGSEPVREWLKGLEQAERHAIGRDLLRAQWRCGGHASLPSDGKRSVGSANRLARKSHGARIDLPLPGPPRGPARLYQENASHA